MKTIYIDKDFKCHPEPSEGMTAVETDFFDGREADIPKYRLVPEGMTWTRSDGITFSGLMIAPRGNGVMNTKGTDK